MAVRDFFSAGLYSLRARLILLILVAIAPALGLALYNAQDQRHRDAAEAHQDALTLVQFASSRQEELITETRQLLAFLAQQPAVQPGNPSACSAYLADLLKPYPAYTSIVIADLKGDLYCSAIPLAQPTNVANRPNFRRAIETRQFTVGDYQVGQTTGRAILGLGYPVIDLDGNVIGVVFAALDLSWLSDFVAQTNLPAGGSLLVVDKNGIVLARHPDDEAWVGRSAAGTPLVKSILAGTGEGALDTRGLDNTGKLYAFTRLGGQRMSGDVYVAVGIPKAIAYGPANRALWRNLAGIGLAVVLALAIVWFGIEMFMVRQIRGLVTATRRLATGDFKQGIGSMHRSGELGELARALDQMAAQLEQRESERARMEQSRIQLAEERARRIRSEIMLTEINHRVKNSLQIAASLLSLQANRLKDPAGKAALRESEGRIRTMALIHSKLNVQGDTPLVDFGRYLRDIVPAMVQAQAERSRIATQVGAPDVLLDWDTVIPCALIVNELVTNALKHAFPGGRTGTIRVELGEETEGRLSLAVSNDGVPLPEGFDFRRAESLGLRLVNALADQLHGSIKLKHDGDLNHDGHLQHNGWTVFTLKFATSKDAGT